MLFGGGTLTLCSRQLSTLAYSPLFPKLTKILFTSFPPKPFRSVAAVVHVVVGRLLRMGSSANRVLKTFNRPNGPVKVVFIIPICFMVALKVLKRK
jgi:hypothetical protein